MEKMHADSNGCYWVINTRSTGEWYAMTDEYGGAMFSSNDYGRLIERIDDHAWQWNVHDYYDDQLKKLEG